MTTEPKGEFLTVRQLAKRLRMSAKTVSRAIADGELRAFRAGSRTRRVAWSDVAEWLEGHRIPSTSHARRRAAEILEKTRQASA